MKPYQITPCDFERPFLGDWVKCVYEKGCPYQRTLIGKLFCRKQDRTEAIERTLSTQIEREIDDSHEWRTG